MEQTKRDGVWSDYRKHVVQYDWWNWWNCPVTDGQHVRQPTCGQTDSEWRFDPVLRSFTSELQQVKDRYLKFYLCILIAFFVICVENLFTSWHEYCKTNRIGRWYRWLSEACNKPTWGLPACPPTYLELRMNGSLSHCVVSVGTLMQTPVSPVIFIKY